MIRVFTERYYRIIFNTLSAENEDFLLNKGQLPFPLQLIITQKRQQQQYIATDATANATAYQFLSILQVTFFARNVNKITRFQGEVVVLFVWLFSEFFSGFFFFMVTEILQKKCTFLPPQNLIAKIIVQKVFLFVDTRRREASLVASCFE